MCAACLLLVLAVQFRRKLQRALPPWMSPRPFRPFALDADLPGESVAWLNAVLAWLFSENMDIARGRLCAALRELGPDIRRHACLGRLLRDARTVKWAVGPMPKFSAVRVSKYLGAGPVLTAHCQYTGGLQFLIELKTIFSMNVHVFVHLGACQGKFVSTWSGNVLYFGLVDPHLSIEDARLQVGRCESALVNHLAKQYVLPRLLRKSVAWPCLKGVYLHSGPQQPPYPWDTKVQSDPEALYSSGLY